MVFPVADDSQVDVVIERFLEHARESHAEEDEPAPQPAPKRKRRG